MKKTFLTLFLALMAFACLFTACSSDDDAPSPMQPITYSLPAQMKVDAEDCEPASLSQKRSSIPCLVPIKTIWDGWTSANMIWCIYKEIQE